MNKDPKKPLDPDEEIHVDPEEDPDPEYEVFDDPEPDPDDPDRFAYGD